MVSTVRLSVLIALVFVALGDMSAGAAAVERTVVVALFDGFSPAVQKAAKTPHLDKMAEQGIWSHNLVPVFPSVSLTNHTSFTTGCWPADHGILSNVFLDPRKGRYDHSYDADWRSGCETIWEAAERQGVLSAAIQIAGRASATKGKLATHANGLGQHFTDDKVTDRAIELLKMTGAKRPRLIALYFTGPDGAAHRNGSVSAEAVVAARKSDMIIGRLMKAIRDLPKDREVTLVVATDHGMIDVGPLINIARIVNKHEIRGKVAAAGASAYIYLDEGESVTRVEAALAEYKQAFDVYRKGAFPTFARLGNGPRAGDLLIVARPPYWIEGPEVFPDYARLLGVTQVWPEIFTPPIKVQRAAHGYDAEAVPQMHGIFYAWGSGIAKGRKIGRIDMVDVHPTVMALLGLKPGISASGKPVSRAFSDN